MTYVKRSVIQPRPLHRRGHPLVCMGPPRATRHAGTTRARERASLGRGARSSVVGLLGLAAGVIS